MWSFFIVLLTDSLTYSYHKKISQTPSLKHQHSNTFTQTPSLKHQHTNTNTQTPTPRTQQVQMADRRIRSAQQSNDAKQTAINFAQDAAVDAQKAAGALYFFFMLQRLSTSSSFDNLSNSHTHKKKQFVPKDLLDVLKLNIVVESHVQMLSQSHEMRHMLHKNHMRMQYVGLCLKIKTHSNSYVDF